MKLKQLLVMTVVILFSMSARAQDVSKTAVKDSVLQEVVKTISRTIEVRMINDTTTTNGGEKVPVVHLKNGTQIPNLKFKDIQGKEVSFADLKGKYIYVDVWATWCMPCVKEIPFLQKLEKEMHGKNIVFVSISCDGNKEVWEKEVKEKKLQGTQWLAGQDKAFFDTYRVTTIPHFMLIDKKGKIIDSFMTRPSDPKTLEVIGALKGL